LVVAVLSFLSRWLMILGSVSPMEIYVSSIARMDALAFGSAVAAWSQMPGGLSKIIQYKSRMLWVAAGLILVARLIPKGLGMTDPMGQTVGYSILAITFALLIAVITARQSLSGEPGKIPFLSAAGMRRVGKYSYAMYIFHVPLSTYVGLVWLERWGWLKHPSTFQGIAYLLAIGTSTYVLSWASYELIEKHFLGLRRYLPVNK
jgi:peptidoglycan/LPS O-acetylase OafA/YrhL